MMSSVKPSLARITTLRGSAAALAGFNILIAGRISKAVSHGRFAAALHRTARA